MTTQAIEPGSSWVWASREDKAVVEVLEAEGDRVTIKVPFSETSQNWSVGDFGLGKRFGPVAHEIMPGSYWRAKELGYHIRVVSILGCVVSFAEVEERAYRSHSIEMFLGLYEAMPADWAPADVEMDDDVCSNNDPGCDAPEDACQPSSLSELLASGGVPADVIAEMAAIKVDAHPEKQPEHERFALLNAEEATATSLDEFWNDDAIYLFEFGPDGTPLRFIDSDGGEPEDQTFYRNWSWVVPLLNKIDKEKLMQPEQPKRKGRKTKAEIEDPTEEARLPQTFDELKAARDRALADAEHYAERMREIRHLERAEKVAAFEAARVELEEFDRQAEELGMQ